MVEPTHLENIGGSFPQGSEWKYKTFETTAQIVISMYVHQRNEKNIILLSNPNFQQENIETTKET